MSNYVRWSGGSNAIIQRFYLNCGGIQPKTLIQKTVNFGKAMPSENYIVSLTITGIPAYWSFVSLSVSDKTKNGFIVNLYNNGDYITEEIYVDWIALSY